jgi:hypothetical protein
VLAEAESTGLSPTEIAHRALAAHTAAAKPGAEAAASLTQSETPIDSEIMVRRRAAVELIRQLSMAADAPKLDLPPNVRFRDWIHEGHKY